MIEIKLYFFFFLPFLLIIIKPNIFNKMTNKSLFTTHNCKTPLTITLNYLLQLHLNI